MGQGSAQAARFQPIAARHLLGIRKSTWPVPAGIVPAGAFLFRRAAEAGDPDADVPGAVRFREYRYLYGGQLLSFLGDQLGAVAIAALVFGRTGSGLLTAIAYAASWLPGILGGSVLATWADRLPRRRVLVACDLARSVLVALVALPVIPLWAVIVLLYIAHLSSTPFTAARSALMPEVLPGEVYILGTGLANITFQFGRSQGSLSAASWSR